MELTTYDRWLLTWGDETFRICEDCATDPRGQRTCSQCDQTIEWRGYQGLCGWCHYVRMGPNRRTHEYDDARVLAAGRTDGSPRLMREMRVFKEFLRTTDLHAEQGFKWVSATTPDVVVRVVSNEILTLVQVHPSRLFGAPCPGINP